MRGLQKGAVAFPHCQAEARQFFAASFPFVGTWLFRLFACLTVFGMV